MQLHIKMNFQIANSFNYVCLTDEEIYVLWLAFLEHPAKWDVSRIVGLWWIVQPSKPYD